MLFSDLKFIQQQKVTAFSFHISLKGCSFLYLLFLNLEALYKHTNINIAHA